MLPQTDPEVISGLNWDQYLLDFTLEFWVGQQPNERQWKLLQDREQQNVSREREREKQKKGENILCGEENKIEKAEYFLIYLKQNLLLRSEKTVK